LKKLESFETPKTLTTKGFKQYMRTLGLVFNDIRLVLASNLHALHRDGRISLKNLLKGAVSPVNPFKLFELIFKLEIKHHETLTEAI
jgi:hypothetical protein